MPLFATAVIPRTREAARTNEYSLEGWASYRADSSLRPISSSHFTIILSRLSGMDVCWKVCCSRSNVVTSRSRGAEDRSHKSVFVMYGRSREHTAFNWLHSL